MSIRTPATIDDLYRVEGKAELINGEIVFMSPTGGRSHYAAGRIYASLLDYEEQSQVGWAIGDNAGFVVDLPNRQSFSPDAGYFVGPDPGVKFFEGAPVFAVEVRSEGDYGPGAEREMAEKRKEYFAAGTQVVWDVDLQSDDVVKVYRATNPLNPTIYRRGENAEADPAVPGWTFAVDKVFRPKRR